MDTHYMPGFFKVGYALILCDHFWNNLPNVGDVFLQVVVIPYKHACILTFVLGV
jgi:hypothetical protein